MAAALVNAGPLGVDVLAHSGDAEKVTAFGNGVLLARIPLFLFQAVQASLLPRLARLAAKGDLTEFVQGLALLLKIVVGVAVLGTVGSYVLGPWALEIMYEGGLDRRTLTLLALASGLYMLCVAIAQAVIALRGHRWVAIGWLSAVVVFLTLTAFSSNDLYLRVEIGLVGASITALIIFGLALKSQIAAGVIPEAESMLDGVLDTPFE
jgi:O-antigen/teichoic acid export membrane protein